MKIENQTFEKERSLYATKNIHIINCKFAGKEDGESVLKECKDNLIENCYFNLRYPLWHNDKVVILNSKFDENTRAAIWYSFKVKMENCLVNSIKVFRECTNVDVVNSSITSDEAFWKCHNVSLSNVNLNSVYAMFESENVHIKNLRFTGKYSFQYTKNLFIEDSYLDTKDAFWHGENITIKNCYVKGEYLGWYSKNLRFINCTIEGLQPLCYAQSLYLENCKMIKTNLSFEYSNVDATIVGNIESIKNPKSGKIVCDSVDEIVNEDNLFDSNCKIIVNETKVQ